MSAINLIVDNKLAWPMVLIILNVLTSATETNNVLRGINSHLFTMILMCAFRKKQTQIKAKEINRLVSHTALPYPSHITVIQ